MRPYHRPGFCPICGSENLNYYDSFPTGVDFIYKWECNDCEAEGSELYELNFIDQIIEYDPRAKSEDQD